MGPRSGLLGGELLEGDLLGNRYELGTLLATGGMGRVWHARDTVLGRPVAVKLLRPEFTGSATFLTRFRAEAQHAAALNHPNIAGVHDYGEAAAGGDSLAYLVMELVQGESLAAVLARVGRLDAVGTLGILRQAAAGLAAAHAAGVVHRDVKPANVLVRTDGVVKLTDFGIAWSATSAPVTRTGQVIGTAAYLSPEQAQGAKATPASDVYALGMVAYECLTGAPAFDGETSLRVARQQIHDPVPPLPPAVPDGLRRLIAAALVKDPAERLPDGAALLAAADRLSRDLADGPSGGGCAEGLATAVGPSPGAVPAPESVPRTGAAPTAVLPAGAPATPEERPRGRGRVLLAAAVCLVTLVLLGAVVLGLRGGDPTTPVAHTTAPPPTPSTSAPTTAATLEVDPADYVGRPVDEVRTRLTELGFQVRVTLVRTTKVAAGIVVAIDPAGALTPGQVVTVSDAVAPPTVAPTTAAADDHTRDDDRTRDDTRGTDDRRDRHDRRGHGKGKPKHGDG